MNAIILTLITSQAFFTFITFLIQRGDNKKVSQEDMKPLKTGLMAFMQHSLERSMSQYLEDGKITTRQLQALNTMVEAYKGLGGNSFVEGLYEECEELHKKIMMNKVK